MSQLWVPMGSRSRHVFFPPHKCTCCFPPVCFLLCQTFRPLVLCVVLAGSRCFVFLLLIQYGHFQVCACGRIYWERYEL